MKNIYGIVRLVICRMAGVGLGRKMLERVGKEVPTGGRGGRGGKRTERGELWINERQRQGQQ